MGFLGLGVGVVRAEKKVTICHHPPGQPAHAQTISVAEAATAAHLKHGDQLGECPTGCELNTSLCEDDNACTSDVCLPNGQCQHGVVNCDDGNPCTADSCQEATGCLNVAANGGPCDDGNACTSGDVCGATTCQGSAVPGCCANDTDCDDGNTCTSDRCIGDACQNQTRDCSVADKCLAGFCDPVTGNCSTTPVACRDSNVCTDDMCDPTIGCFFCPSSHPPEPREVSCNDGADNDCDGAADAADPDCAPRPGLIGSACTINDECLGSDGFCVLGFCTRTCGSGGTVSNCNANALAVPPGQGPYGGSFACWPLGPGFPSLCWPNGSGVACSASVPCTRTGESCIAGRCTFAVGGVPRSNLRCHADDECLAGEACVPFSQLDDLDLRSDGACLPAGDPPNRRKAAGGTCVASSECASLLCLARGTCAALCADDSDCGPTGKCGVVPQTPAPPLGEFPTSYLGVCEPSGAACSANATCAANESCVAFEALSSNALSVEMHAACRPLPNPAGLGVGASCASDAQCASGRCAANPLTVLGYCTAFCVGGDADCGGGTTCRALVSDPRDPSTEADDLRAGECVQTSVGSTCRAMTACISCSVDADCNPGQEVRCVKAVPAAATGFCRDKFGRCADPCRHGCIEGDPASCPLGSSCTVAQISQTESATYCADTQTGQCVRADLPKVFRYEHGMCGDAEFPLGGGPRAPQQDLCYYFGAQTFGGVQSNIFTCGSGCDAGTVCPAIPVSGGGSIDTVCRTVYEFGVNLSSGSTVGGAAMSPQQCAPPNAFVGQTPP